MFCLPQPTFLPRCWKADFDVVTTFLEIIKINVNIPALLLAEQLPAEGKEQMNLLFCFAAFALPANAILISTHGFLSLHHTKRGIGPTCLYCFHLFILVDYPNNRRLWEKARLRSAKGCVVRQAQDFIHVPQLPADSQCRAQQTDCSVIHTASKECSI